MAIDYDSIQLGLVLGKNVQTVTDMNQNVFDSESVSDLQITGLNSIQLSTSVIFTRYTLATSVFQLDHTVYGLLDRYTLRMVGGYASAGSVIGSTVN